MDKDKALQFLGQLIDKINKQDNRGTAMPYFYVIKTEKWRLCKDGYGSGVTRTGRVDHSGDPDVYYSKEDFIKTYLERRSDELTPPESPGQLQSDIDASHYQQYNLALTKAKKDAEEAWENLEEFEEEQYEDEENVFFTEEAFKEHVRLNGHNLGRRGEYYSYVKHAFRNPELENLLLAIAAVTGREFIRK